MTGPRSAPRYRFRLITPMTLLPPSMLSADRFVELVPVSGSDRLPPQPTMDTTTGSTTENLARMVSPLL